MLKLLLADLKMMVRNKQALFWSLMFPVMFTLIFGLFFGRSNNIAGTVALVNNSNTTLADNLEQGLKDAEIFSIKNSNNLDESKNEVENGKISAVVYIPQNFGSTDSDSPKQITVISDPANTQVVSILNSFLDKYLTSASFQIQNTQPIYSIKQESVGSSSADFSYFAFVLAGILGLALMNGSIMGVGVGISRYKEDKILKRITTTPLPGWKFLLAEVVSRLVLNVFQIAIILAIGIYGFNAEFAGNLGILLLVALFGGVLFQLIGFIIAGFAKTADAAQGMAQAVTIPMMFLAGVFFPIDALPKWLYNVVQFLPLAPLLRMLRGVGIDAKSPFENPLNIGIVSAWIVIALFIAVWKFKLSEE